jgi:hypothetical protein
MEEQKIEEIKIKEPEVQTQKETYFYMWTGRRWVLTQSVRQYRS